MFPLQDSIPSRTPPIATYYLIGINVLVFMLELSLGPAGIKSLFYHFGIVPARFSHPAWAEQAGLPLQNYWPFVTNIFLHGGWMHVLGNMWTLWIFGDNVEDRLGHGRFMIFYLLCGIIAGIVHCMVNPLSTVPALGASGAIAGVMGAYFILYPHSRIIVLIPVLIFPFFFEVPAILYLGIWFLMQLASGSFALLGPSQVGGIAFWAHVGGFGAGLLSLPLFLIARGRRKMHLDEFGIKSAWTSAWPRHH